MMSLLPLMAVCPASAGHLPLFLRVSCVMSPGCFFNAGAAGPSPLPVTP